MVDLVSIGLSVDSRTVVKGKNALKDLGEQAGKTEKSAKKMSSAFKVGLAAAMAASTAAAWQAVNAHREFTKSISELSAITGAVGDDLKFYKEQAMEMGASTTFAASEVAQAFKLVASAKPDLLASKEALSAVTKEVLTLAEASGMELTDAANSLGGALNQFGAGAESASEFINVLAAGSKFGASEINNTSEALKNVGAVASSVGLSFEQTNAAIQALAANSIKGAEAGTGLRGVLLKLADQSNAKFNPEIVGLEEALLNLRDANLTTTEKMDLFGQESFKEATALIEQADSVGELTDALTGTDTAYEQARINTDNLDGDMKSLQSSIEGQVLTIMEKLDPALRAAVKAFTWLASVISPLVQILAVGGALYAGFLATSAVIGAFSLSATAAAVSSAALSAAQFSIVTAMYAVVAPISTATIGINALGASLAASASATWANIAAFGVLKSAFALAFAAFAGWKIGEFLAEEFEIVKKFGIALAGGLHSIAISISNAFMLMGEEIKHALSNPLDVARNKISEFLNWIKGMNVAALKFFGLDDIASNLDASFTHVKTKTQAEHDAYMATLEAQAKKEAETVSNTYAEMFAEVGQEREAALISGDGGAKQSDVAQAVATGAVSDEAMQARLDSLRNQYASEQELALQAFNEQKELISELESAKLIEDQEARDLEFEAKWEYENKLFEMEDQAAQERIALKERELQAKQQAEKTFWDNMTSLMSSGTKKMFEMGKRVAIARAVIDGTKSAIAAWRAGMEVGGPAAPAIAAAYTAASLLRTASMINSLKSASFSGGGGVSAGGGGGVSIGADFNGGAGAGGQAINQMEEKPAKKEIRVTFEGDNVHSPAMRKFAEDLKETMADMGSDVGLVIS